MFSTSLPIRRVARDEEGVGGDDSASRGAAALHASMRLVDSGSGGFLSLRTGPPRRPRVRGRSRDLSPSVRGKMVGDEHSTSERTLSLREYKALLKTRDPGRLKIKKTRRAFLWRDEYYMLDTFHSPESASGADSASALTLNLPGSRRWRANVPTQARRRSSSRRPRASLVSRPSSRPRSTSRRSTGFLPVLMIATRGR